MEGIYYIDKDGKAHPCTFSREVDFEISKTDYDFGWHYVRDDPNDLPEFKDDGLEHSVLCKVISIGEDEETGKEFEYYEYVVLVFDISDKTFRESKNGYCVCHEVVKWKYIEDENLYEYDEDCKT